MRRSLSAACVLLGISAATANLSAQEAPGPLAELVEAWEAAFNAGDAAAVAALYTEDPVRIPPEEAIIRGREEIQANIEAFAGASIEITAYGGLLGEDVASTWGVYELSGTVGGEAISQRGRWMNAVKKTEDGWRIHRDIWHLAPEE
jgi:uncharacterized protein (TIGR02246 family)